MLFTKARIDKELGEDVDRELFLAPFETAFEIELDRIGEVVAKDHVVRFDRLVLFLLLLAIFNVAVFGAVLRNRVTPKLLAATGLLADLEFDSFFLFVFR